MFTKMIMNILYWLKAHDFGLNVWSITVIILSVCAIAAFFDWLAKKGENSVFWSIIGGIISLIFLVICVSYALFELTGAW